MKCLAASVVILAGAILLTGGSFVQHSDTKLFVQAVGCVVGIIGFAAWFFTFRQSGEK
jgi:Na+/melibiose symporter-like transporter